ncbi:hypothetical protein FB192DRAFT_1419381 [Mucor lusitanicus]|uniref:Uncharacterized protein n=1 Tax=Mucor circinelloides f. lusitanicus TaxID=29924 RepID=A0A8H4BQW2_MUCCL|nr:hypothetical protein FB192DRAFT_1419381 [Mucor lusitanicus]
MTYESGAYKNQQRLVEFYDSRACVEAYDATYNTEYMGGRWDVAFFWDHPYRDRSNANHRRERNHHERERDEPRGSNRRRSDTVRPPRDYDHYSGGGRKDDRYASNAPPPPQTPATVAPMHQSADPRLQYNPQMPHQLPVGGAPMSNLSASNAAAMPDGQRLEQAQKAQQILSMLAQQPPQQQAASLTSPFQPTNLQSPPPPPPTAFVAPVPPTEDQASQVQQLLGLLSQAAQQQQQHQQQQQQQQQQQVVSPQPLIHPSQPGGVAPIPGMDPATALSQLAAMLQQQQQQQQQNNQNQ